MNRGTLVRCCRALARNAARPGRLLNLAKGRLCSRPADGSIRWAPYTLRVEPTIRCNLKCPMCLHAYWERAAPDMTLDGFRFILDGSPHLMKVLLQGMGEPLLSPHFFDLVGEAARRGIVAHVNTNGTVLTERNVERIYDSGLLAIGVSLDTSRAESYARIRVGGKIEPVTDGLRRLCSHRSRSELLVEVSATAWQSTLGEMPDLVRYCADLGVDVLFIHCLLGNWGAAEVEAAVKPERVILDDEFREVAQRCREAAKAGGLALRMTPPNDTSRVEPERPRYVRPDCDWPWWSANITSDGHVTPCCNIVDPATVSLGNALETPFIDIWNGPKYRAFRRTLLAGQAPWACRGFCRVGLAL